MPKSTLILLALEEGQTQLLFDRALAAAGYQSEVTHDRAELDKALQESSPAMIIVSQNFHGVDGLRVASSLLDRFPTLPILLYLSQDSPLLVREALHLGISDCLYPALRVEDVIHTVENSLKRAQHLGDWTRRQVRLTTSSLQQRLNELQKLEKIIDTIEDGVMILDENYHILTVNPPVRRTFGFWKDDDILGRPVLEVIPNQDLRNLLDFEAENSVPHNEIAFEDGRVLSAQYARIPGVGFAITMQDISYLKQLDRLKSEFVHSVSHDLRSPLTAILGYVDLLERVGPLNSQQREFVSRVQHSVTSITNLVNDLLDLGRIEAGFDLQKQMVPVEAMIRDTMDAWEPQIQDKKPKFRLELPVADIPPMRGNPIRLRQMLDNLLGNAIKYTPEGGDITIEMELQGEQVILRMSDNGPGIPPADQPHIFEKFYRASNVPKGVGGSGLGLAIVKSIIDNHQGRIWVDSVVGKGSTFTVVIPVFEPKAAPPA